MLKLFLPIIVSGAILLVSCLYLSFLASLFKGLWELDENIVRTRKEVSDVDQIVPALRC